MPHDRIDAALRAALAELDAGGRRKGAETVITGVIAPQGGRGPRYRIAGEGERAFLRMNANSYLGLALHPDVIAADDAAVRAYGAGPGAARFISGTWAPHVALERRLAAFHGREAAILYSSAYAAVMGTLPTLITPETAVISDALNHNCIINAMRLARPAEKHVYRHLDLGELEARLADAAKACRRAIVVTDGIFSMRGDHAPLAEIMAIARRHDAAFAENVVVMVDDSHGVGAFGATGRGTEEHCAAPPADILVGTIGKAFGVNGGYVAGSAALIDTLREVSPFYVYSNPITPGEAAAALAALDILEGPRGRALLDHLRAMTRRFSDGLKALGFETIAGGHPVVPLMVRDGERTRALVRHLRARGILATGLGYPVVPRGDEEIRFQICADHTPADIDEALAALAAFRAAG
ncbi:MAG: aminotransferase class I/II-fold pyridoxal phosphate-dependent enzyme [Alphaproteobacteria bacterium]|nr:aminotransferase class I/II-fold pyridoxal phosphate-dependent enzyme [Alphaproteobacteria bacterium]